jgi:hypothetical protein
MSYVNSACTDLFSEAAYNEQFVRTVSVYYGWQTYGGIDFLCKCHWLLSRLSVRQTLEYREVRVCVPVDCT